MKEKIEKYLAKIHQFTLTIHTIYFQNFSKELIISISQMKNCTNS